MGSQPIDVPSTAAWGADGAAQRWAAGGGLWLSGRRDGPPLPPPVEMVTGLERLAGRSAAGARVLGAAIELDAVRLVTERAATAGLHRDGTTSCGGATRLLRTADGWVAVSLARATDVELVPAWLELPGPESTDVWTVVASHAADRDAADLLDRARMLGLPVAALGETAVPGPPGSLPVNASRLDGAPTDPRPLADLLVVDLSALWAGPLCGALLAQSGATVVKVESAQRPDGARLGPAAFFDRLNGSKRSAVLPLGVPEGPDLLRQVISAADVVIEASRPRALRQLGIDAFEMLGRGPRVWVSITGHGRYGGNADRVAFGDDAAVAGGLVCWEDDEPRFCADAIADPAAGLTAFAAAVEALADGGRWMLDVSMAGVAADLARGGRPAPQRALAALPPEARATVLPAPQAGEATAWLLERAGVA